MKKAFTLAETMIVIVILGVISSFVFPALFQQNPNKEKVMFKKAYFLTERIISELTNDEVFYPFQTDKTVLSNIDEITYNGTTYSGESKFCNLFATLLNTIDTPSCAEAKPFVDFEVSTGNFTTTDGISWSLPISDFSSPSDAYSMYVDVNGDKGPNCLSGTECPDTQPECCKKPDRFTINIYSTGRINVTSTIEQNYLKDDKFN